MHMLIRDEPNVASAIARDYAVQRNLLGHGLLSEDEAQISYKSLFLDRRTAQESCLKEDFLVRSERGSKMLVRPWLQNDGSFMKNEKGVPIFIIFARGICEIFDLVSRNYALLSELFIEFLSSLMNKRSETASKNFCGFILLLSRSGKNFEQTLSTLFAFARSRGYAICSVEQPFGDYQISIYHDEKQSALHLTFREDIDILESVNSKSEMSNATKRKSLQYIETFISDCGLHALQALQLKVVDDINRIAKKSYFVMI